MLLRLLRKLAAFMVAGGTIVGFFALVAALALFLPSGEQPDIKLHPGWVSLGGLVAFSIGGGFLLATKSVAKERGL